MDASPSHNEVVSKSKRGLLTALALLTLVAAALAVTYFFLGGDQLVADFLGGSSTNTATVVPSKPATPSTDSTESADSGTGTTSDDATDTADTADTAGTSDTSDGSGDTGTAANPPTADQAARMYWEQVASQEQIGKLVNGEISAVTIGTVTKSGSTANVRITVAYKAGGTLSGTMVLRDYSGVWYFSSIARDGNSLSTRTSKPGDAGIVSTIVSQQAANQSIPLGIINGGYKTITIAKTSMGSGTATLGITLSGGTSAKTAGTITCVSKVINGEKMWFISSFAKK